MGSIIESAMILQRSILVVYRHHSIFDCNDGSERDTILISIRNTSNEFWTVVIGACRGMGVFTKEGWLVDFFVKG